MTPRHACLACVESVGVSGAGLMVTGGMKSPEPVCVTDSRAGDVEELQATLGQGPGNDALEAGRLGVGAMYSLPLALGAIRVGVLDLYNDTPEHLNQDRLVDALVYADTALLLVLDVRRPRCKGTALSGVRPAEFRPRPAGGHAASPNRLAASVTRVPR